MSRFVEAEPRSQATLFPERIEDYIDEENPVRALDAFVDMLNLEGLGFSSMTPKATDLLIIRQRCSSFIFMAI